MTTQILHVINGATATATSSWIDIKDAESVIILMQRSNHSAGTTTLTAHIAVDSAGTNATALNTLIDNVTNTNAQNYTRVASKALNSDSTAVLAVDPMFMGGYLRLTLTEATDGTHDAWVIIKKVN